ncbi:MAG: ABC transporter permease [Dehalococcoidia bacterium]|nr:MAG: ABC transporter permease [Dehalococcoidia bacterium]
MSLRCTLATAARVLRQLRRDRRTVAMLLLVPVGLMALMSGVFAGVGGAFQRVGVPLLGVFPMTSMFIVTAVTMQRERSSGTLERLMAMPIGKFDLVLGYALAFGLLALVQAVITSVVSFTLLDLRVDGPTWGIVLIAGLDAVLGTAFGLLVSAFARTEFQAVQFLPLFLLPQVFLSGLMAPRERMPGALQAASDVLPLTYAYDALRSLTVSGALTSTLVRDVTILVVTTVTALVLGAVTLRRRTG